MHVSGNSWYWDSEEEMKNLQTEFSLLKALINNPETVESICKQGYEQINLY